jgi:hypothetical protein
MVRRAKMANKYGAKKIEINGHVFDSKREAEYYKMYKKMVDDGEIVGLELQQCFTLIPPFTNWEGKKVRPCHYTADFLLTMPDGKKRVIEVKGFRTRDYTLRRKMFEYKYSDLTIEEV